MEPLLIDSVHFYPKENAKTHNTVKFEAVDGESPTTTVVRRGQPFYGAVRFTRPFDEYEDLVQLIFSLGDKPTLDTQGSMFLRRDVIADKHLWSATITAVEGDTVTFDVYTPMTVPVGCWTLRIVTRTRSFTAPMVYDFDQDIYILFNPWRPDDQVYMEDSKLLREYVLNDVGKVWMGPVNTTRGTPWVYGQFDDIVLKACTMLLNKAQLPFHQRGDPIKLTRAISRIVNSYDDDGVLEGRWDDEYEDGTAPSEWTGSVDILSQYMETRQPVKYGQCWVFAGVVTTVCRALGIPTRSVSNIVSAHDVNSSLSIDKYYTENMEEQNFEVQDSIWNYHVWNDVWMERPDLPPGYGGWQAIDATPQEISSGMYQCGPAPLEAIKEGVIGLSYDVAFMLATVNADLMRWRVDHLSDSGYSLVDTNKYHIGRMILTKKPDVFDPLGDEDRQDVTEEYKHREGTASERLALMNGVRVSERAKRYYATADALNNDVYFSLTDIDTVHIGKPFRVVVDIANNSYYVRNIKASLKATSVYYHGVQGVILKKEEGKLSLQPKQTTQLIIEVKPEEYLPKLVEYFNVKISAMAFVDETKQSWADNDDFQILKPNISIQFNEALLLGQPATAVLTFTNPLERPLTACEFRVTSPGIVGRTLRVLAANAVPLGMVFAELPVQPNKSGIINFVATFKSAELNAINGAATVEVY